MKKHKQDRNKILNS